MPLPIQLAHRWLNDSARLVSQACCRICVQTVNHRSPSNIGMAVRSALTPSLSLHSMRRRSKTISFALRFANTLSDTLCLAI
jgi:hypothetical protein